MILASSLLVSVFCERTTSQVHNINLHTTLLWHRMNVFEVLQLEQDLLHVVGSLDKIHCLFLTWYISPAPSPLWWWFPRRGFPLHFLSFQQANAASHPVRLIYNRIPKTGSTVVKNVLHSLKRIHHFTFLSSSDFNHQQATLQDQVNSLFPGAEHLFRSVCKGWPCSFISRSSVTILNCLLHIHVQTQLFY